jgi:hypothetical protein
MIIEVEGRYKGIEPPTGFDASQLRSPDLQAVDFHLQSLTEDEGPCTIITTAHQVQMEKLDAPAYRLHVRIELSNEGGVDDDSKPEKAVTSCHMFFARLEKQEADLIVWVNVPGVVVGDSSVAEAVDERDDIAASILDKLGQSFELGGSDEWKIVEEGFRSGPEAGSSS